MPCPLVILTDDKNFFGRSVQKTCQHGGSCPRSAQQSGSRSRRYYTTFQVHDYSGSTRCGLPALRCCKKIAKYLRHCPSFVTQIVTCATIYSSLLSSVSRYSSSTPVLRHVPVAIIAIGRVDLKPFQHHNVGGGTTAVVPINLGHIVMISPRQRW